MGPVNENIKFSLICILLRTRIYHHVFKVMWGLINNKLTELPMATGPCLSPRPTCNKTGPVSVNIKFQPHIRIILNPQMTTFRGPHTYHYGFQVMRLRGLINNTLTDWSLMQSPLNRRAPRSPMGSVSENTKFSLILRSSRTCIWLGSGDPIHIIKGTGWP
jgi:hypothetical protein